VAFPTPHPATTDLKTLPVPPLDDTLDAYSHALEAVLDSSELAHARSVVEDFRTGAGPLLDAKLRERAAEREASGTNWLNDEWYSSYLTTRDPLTLTTNVGFQIALPAAENTGLDRAVEFIQRAATVHLAAAAGTIEEDVDARGNRITINQWFVYAGGIRHPEKTEDTVIATDLGAENREIGVFVNGRLFALPISDANGAILPAAALRAGLEKAQHLAAGNPAGLDFNAPSLLGSAALAELLPTILEQGDNRATYARLQDMLFTIDLQNGPDTPDTPDSDRIREATFSPRGAWVYKPLSYQVGLNSDWIAVHVEHSCQDGATLVTAITRMQNANLEVATTTNSAISPTDISPTELTWDLDETTTQNLHEQLDAFNAAAQKLETDIITVPHNLPADLPFKVSRDASAQLTMHIAQQLTYGHVRAVYEAVDMREYRAGRTECLRAATPEAVTFAEKLIDATATQTDLQAALEAHRGWVKRCKSGNGFDRHIQMMATIEDPESGSAGTDAFFTDRLATAARRDFLSTTSIGGPNQIVRYCFAPTLPEGFGISYTPLPSDAEYCTSWNTDTAEKPAEFRANLTRASKMLWVFCADLV